MIIDKYPANIESGRLPRVYETPRTAIAQCSRVDESQQWANKAEASASYPKQSGDQMLRKCADRIQARAICRCGELLRELESCTGAHTDLKPRVGALPRLSPTAAVQEAGLSEHQSRTALRVASIDGDTFESQIQSDSPPTVTQFANQGKKESPKQYLIDLAGIDPKDFSRATQALGSLRELAQFVTENDPLAIARGTKRF
jgi:hypothetical protein